MTETTIWPAGPERDRLAATERTAILAALATGRRRPGAVKRELQRLLGVGVPDDRLDELVAEARRIVEVRDERRARRVGIDPLLTASQMRPFQTARYKAARAAEWAAFKAEREREEAVRIAREEAAAAIRQTLIRAARVARGLGLDVRSSTGRDGRVSSYYVRRLDGGGGRPLRISDHEIPWTHQRADTALAHGEFAYDGYHGAEMLIDAPASAEWLRGEIRRLTGEVVDASADIEIGRDYAPA